jgi:pimeloyl-ACP methyl ester carboxylesterase
MLRTMALLAAVIAVGALPLMAASKDIDRRVENHFADHDGVKIHYVAIGKGPLIVMVHGWPDFWYTWRDQMEALSSHYRVVAMDLRGFNLSDKPKGVENYDMKLLIGDLAAVIQDASKDAGPGSAIVIGHDWGGMISWTLAMYRPELVEKLIILNLPHPRGLNRELVHNPAQQKNSQYARNNQQPDAASKLTAEGLAFWVTDKEARPKYIEAFKRSDFEAMMNYYKANYPKEPYQEDTSPVVKVKASVLQIHGLADTALLPGALNNTWDYLEKDWTLVTIPGAGHFVQQDASDLVTRSIISWLNR